MRKLLLASAAFLVACSAQAQKSDYGPPSEVQDIYSIAIEPSAERIQADIQTLVDFGTRHTLSETQSDTRGIGAARRWIFTEFEKISADCGGCLEVIYVSDTVSGERRIPDPVEVVSVLAIQKGTIDPNRYVMMSGDIDSRVTDPLNGTDDSPGANDNASGMAGTIEAARILSKRKYAGSIIYAGLSGEEQGLFGGKIVAEHALKEGWEIKGVLNNDMISNITRARRFTGGEVDSPSRNLARYIKAQADQYMTNLNVMLIYRLDRFGRGGHHRPFNVVGIPGIRIMETHEHYDRQHQDLRTEGGIIYGDTMEGVDSQYAAKLTALNMVTMAGMAGAPPFPANVEATGAVQPSAKLSWETPENASNLAGYRVHWRLTTAPEWTHSRFIGKVNEWEFKNLVIDNYFFGVSAVAKDGSETPVVFPGAAGRV